MIERADMRMLQWITETSLRESFCNDEIRKRIEVKISDKIIRKMRHVDIW